MRQRIATYHHTKANSSSEIARASTLANSTPAICVLFLIIFPYYLLCANGGRAAVQTSRPLKKTRPKRGRSASKPVHRVCSEVLPTIAPVGCGATVTAVALCAVDLRCTKKGPRLEGRGPSGLCTSHA